jgi:hypothetical protein
MNKTPKRGGWSGGPVPEESNARFALVAVAIGLVALGVFLLVVLP